MALYIFFFFLKEEDGIRDVAVTGVQTCALPIYPGRKPGDPFRFDFERNDRRNPSRAERDPDRKKQGGGSPAARSFHKQAPRAYLPGRGSLFSCRQQQERNVRRWKTRLAGAARGRDRVPDRSVPDPLFPRKKPASPSRATYGRSRFRDRSSPFDQPESSSENILYYFRNDRL